MVYDRQFHLQCENAEAKEFFIKQLYKVIRFFPANLWHMA